MEAVIMTQTMAQRKQWRQEGTEGGPFRAGKAGGLGNHFCCVPVTSGIVWSQALNTSRMDKMSLAGPFQEQETVTPASNKGEEVIS